MIVAIGNPVYDEIITPHVRTEGRVLSGCSTNACLALARLGHRTLLIGNVGADYAPAFEADLDRYGVAHRVGRSRETGGFRLVYDERGDRTLEVLGDAGPVGPIGSLPEDTQAVIVGPILGECGPDTLREVRDRTDALCALDVQGLVRVRENGRILRRTSEAVDEALSLSHIAKPNEHEARVITGIDPRLDAARAAREIHARGCEVAIVTLAEAGSVIFDGSTLLEIPPYRTLARDSTGAGDTYLGGFVARWLETGGASLDRVGRFASAVASVMIEHTGPDFPLDRDEAERRTAALVSV